MLAPQETDASLVAKARAGDASAVGTLYERYYPRVRQVVRHYVWTEDADDLIHDTFVKAIAHFPGTRPDTNARTWLDRIAERTALDYIRSSHVKKSRPVGLAPGTEQSEALVTWPPMAPRVDPGPGPEERALAKERLALAQELLEAVSPADREALILVAGGASLAEIGRHQIRPPSSIRPALFRARVTLAQRVKADPERYSPLGIERADRSLSHKTSGMRPSHQSLPEGSS